MSVISNIQFIPRALSTSWWRQISNKILKKKLYAKRYTLRPFCERSPLVGYPKFGAGFTLIELLVVIMILSTMVVGMIIYLNPAKQLDKVKDARRKSDAQQIKSALDLYYNDHNCYPYSLPFGSSWRKGNVTYMKKVPQDPDCGSVASGENCYRYQVPGGVACPQWNVLYTRNEGGSSIGVSTACPLADSCKPADDMSTWSCVVSGAVNCNIISNNAIPTSIESVEGPPAPPGSSTTCPVSSYICPANGDCNVGSSGVGPTFCTLEECVAAKLDGQC